MSTDKTVKVVVYVNWGDHSPEGLQRLLNNVDSQVEKKLTQKFKPTLFSEDAKVKWFKAIVRDLANLCENLADVADVT